MNVCPNLQFEAGRFAAQIPHVRNASCPYSPKSTAAFFFLDFVFFPLILHLLSLSTVLPARLHSRSDIHLSRLRAAHFNISLVVVSSSPFFVGSSMYRSTQVSSSSSLSPISTRPSKNEKGRVKKERKFCCDCSWLSSFRNFIVIAVLVSAVPSSLGRIEAALSSGFSQYSCPNCRPLCGKQGPTKRWRKQEI